MCRDMIINNVFTNVILNTNTTLYLKTFDLAYLPTFYYKFASQQRISLWIVHTYRNTPRKILNNKHTRS